MTISDQSISFRFSLSALCTGEVAPSIVAVRGAVLNIAKHSQRVYRLSQGQYSSNLYGWQGGTNGGSQAMRKAMKGEERKKKEGLNGSE